MAPGCPLQRPLTFDKRLVRHAGPWRAPPPGFRHATRSGDTPMFEPENAGELGQALEVAEESVTGARRGTAAESGACRRCDDNHGRISSKVFSRRGFGRETLAERALRCAMHHPAGLEITSAGTLPVMGSQPSSKVTSAISRQPTGPLDGLPVVDEQILHGVIPDAAGRRRRAAPRGHPTARLRRGSPCRRTMRTRSGLSPESRPRWQGAA